MQALAATDQLLCFTDTGRPSAHVCVIRFDLLVCSAQPLVPQIWPAIEVNRSDHLHVAQHCRQPAFIRYSDEDPPCRHLRPQCGIWLLINFNTCNCIIG